MQEGKLLPYKKSEPIPEVNNEPVKVVVADSLQDMVLNSGKNGLYDQLFCSLLINLSSLNLTEYPAYLSNSFSWLSASCLNTWALNTQILSPPSHNFCPFSIFFMAI